MNLITNAIQSINDKGDIVITTKKIKDHLVVIIKDNGIGISKESQKSL